MKVDGCIDGMIQSGKEIKNASIETIKFILSKGADPNLPDNDGLTAFTPSMLIIFFRYFIKFFLYFGHRISPHIIKNTIVILPYLFTIFYTIFKIYYSHESNWK